jgi:DNA-binding FadR family transcriptional regulator
MAGLAAERASQEQLDRLAAIQQRLDSRYAALGDTVPTREVAAEIAELDLSFHRELAAATGNKLFGVMLDSIAQVLLEARRDKYMAPGVIQVARRRIADILLALGSRDAERARTAMRDGLAESERIWREL